MSKKTIGENDGLISFKVLLKWFLLGVLVVALAFLIGYISFVLCL